MSPITTPTVNPDRWSHDFTHKQHFQTSLCQTQVVSSVHVMPSATSPIGVAVCSD
jgi:hypothetical protein